MPRWPNSNDKPAIVYRAVNLINGKSYVGISVRTLGERAAQHFKEARLNKHMSSALHSAVRKYGSEMFRFVELRACADADEAKTEERRLIALWKPEYNLTAGGDGSLGYRWTKEQRAKFKPSRYWLGKKRSPETIQKIRQTKIGKPRAPLPGHTIEANRVRFTLLGLKNGKPVTAYPDALTFLSARAAADHYGLNRLSVCQAAQRGTCLYGHRFEYGGVS